MDLVVMSMKELSRLEICGRVVDKRMTQERAAELLDLTERQVRRLLRAYRSGGAGALVSRNRGKRSNRKYSDGVRSRALAIVRERYADFGPTLACEKLLEAHGIRLSVETVRQWLTEEGIWLPRALRPGRAHQPRYRRACIGELVQIDGGDHAWFEGRGPKCTMLVFVDDATSALKELLFVDEESAFDYFAAFRRYLEQFGKPVAPYTTATASST
jgi:transposase